MSAGALATVISAASLGAVYSRWDRENRTTPQIVADWGPLEEASFNAARAALHVSTLYGRERHRRMRHEQALPALERLAQSNVRYQKQLEDVREGIHRLDKEIDAHLREYLSLVGTLAADPERFGRIKPKLLALELPDAGKVARRHLVGHVEGAPRAGAAATPGWASLAASYTSAALW